MIIVDTALQKRLDAGNPVRVGMIGAGFMGRGIALQILSSVPGMRLVGISNRTISEAEKAYHQAGEESVKRVDTVAQLDHAMDLGQYAVTEDPMVLCRSERVEAIIEVTGEVEFGAQVVMEAIQNGKHVILMNAELDALIGPILKVYADQKGVIYTNADGDQPGVIMNLFRFVKGIGYKPVLAGNIKGLQDPYRTPETQRAFAEKHHQKPRMVTSFADGTKISMEMAIVANATGLKVGKRGMYGPECSHVNETTTLFPMDQLMDGGLVDYILGSEPSPGVFILGFNNHPIKKQYMKTFKLGEGPLYVFYTPYHLCHFEVPNTVARAVLLNDAALAPMGGPVVDVITTAKKDLLKEETLDAFGGFSTYGMAENFITARRENLLPMSLAEGCRLKQDIPKDQVLTYNDIELPKGRLCDKLWKEQSGYNNF
jgi:predicted homoserine dehydrogenase-like protein